MSQAQFNMISEALQRIEKLEAGNSEHIEQPNNLEERITKLEGEIKAMKARMGKKDSVFG